MELRTLKLTNFKNIGHAELEMAPGVNCFLGDNGMGKSNLLDSIYFLSFCRSYTGVTDQMLIRRDEDFAMLSGRYSRRQADEELTAGLQRGRRKSLKRSGKEYQRLSEHIGKFPAVMVSPSDAILVTGTSEDRRRFLDPVIAQSDAHYLDALIRYNKALEQRNSLLRNGSIDAGLFQAVEMQMEMAGEYLTRQRSLQLERLGKIFADYYSVISGSAEQPGFAYLPGTKCAPGQGLADRLAEIRDRDRIIRHTTEGPHRDDIDMQLDGMPVRRIASQGQSKTYTIALRLAQFEFLRKATGVTPLLLLDDIFDKLDAGRVERIMNLVTSGALGQTFITDTNRRHFDEIVARTGDNYRLWSVDHGVFTPFER